MFCKFAPPQITLENANALLTCPFGHRTSCWDYLLKRTLKNSKKSDIVANQFKELIFREKNV